MTDAKRDNNRVTTLLGVSSLDLTTPTRIASNPTTGALLIDSTSLLAGLNTHYLKLDASNDPITGNLLLQPVVDSLTALVVNDKDANNVLTVDTINNRVGIGITAPTAKLHIVGSADTQQLIVKANATQTTNLQEWQNSSAGVLSSISPTGALTVHPTDLDATNLTIYGRTTHTARTIPPHATISWGNLFNAYCYAGDGTSTQLMNTFLVSTTVAGESAVDEIGGLYTKLYHGAGFTLPEWRGIESGTAYADGAGSVITFSSGFTATLPICLDGGTVTTSAGIYIPPRGDTTGLGTIYSIYSKLLQPSYWAATVEIENAGIAVDAWRTGGQSSFRMSGYTNNTANGGNMLFRGARGTYAAPDNIGAADELGTVRWSAYTTDGTPGFREVARLTTFMNGTTSATSYASKMLFKTVITGATATATMLSLYDGTAELHGVLNTSGGTLRLSRYHSTVLANGNIGTIEFWNNDLTLSTQNIYANIVVTASQAITTDAAAGLMVFNVTGTTAGGGPLEHMRFKPGTAAALSFYGATPVVQPSAYTQTYSTASKTVPADTAADLATTATTQITPYGFATQAQGDNIATQFNLLRADVLALKKVVNALIDDHQALGLTT